MIDPTHEFPNTCVTVQALQEEQPTEGNVVPSTALSIRSNEADDQVGFNVFPNPASNELVVRYTNGIQLEVYSTFGVLVMETPLDTSIKQSVLDVRKLASGVYYLRLEQADGTTQTRKVVINH